MNENKTKKPVKKKIRLKIKLGYVLAFVAILLVIIVAIKLVLPSGSSKYGNRLDGIKKITFGTKEKDKIVDKLKENDKVTEAKVDVEGKIINIIFNVTKDTSKDDAKKIAGDSLSVITDEVKGFYDIQYMVSKKDEEGTKKTVKKDDGTEEEITETVFPIMGYKNTKSSGIVW